MGYLVCKKCKGFYELQEGESPEDYLRCHCGGVIQYYETLEEYKEHVKNPKESLLVFQCPDPNCAHVQELESGDKCPKCGKTSLEMTRTEAIKLINTKLSKNRIKQTPPNKPQSSPGGVSKEKPINNFNKQSSGTKAATVLGVCCIGVILIIFLGGMLFPESSKTFTGPSMSFQYPSDWNVYSTSANSVTLNKEGKEIYIELISNSLENEIGEILLDGYEFQRDDEESGTKYKVFETEGYDPGYVFIFQKNGKTFQIVGYSSDSATMLKIIRTIN